MNNLYLVEINQPLRKIKKEVVISRILQYNGNKTAAARSLGISLRSIYHWLNNHQTQLVFSLLALLLFTGAAYGAAVPGEVIVKVAAPAAGIHPAALNDDLGKDFGARSSEIVMGQAMYRTVPWQGARGIITLSGSASVIYKLTYSEGTDTLAVIKKLEKDPRVSYAEPNYLFELTETPNDPAYSSQWSLKQINAEEAFGLAASTREVTVAIIDTGVDFNHPDLLENIWQNSGETGIDENGNDKRFNGKDDDNNGYIDDREGWDFVSVNPKLVAPDEDAGPADNVPQDRQGHGTHLAGIAGATTNNAMGIASLGGTVKIMPLRAAFKSVTGAGFISTADAARAIVYAVDNGARIINISWGSTADARIIREAVEYAVSHRVLVVAAAGNMNSSLPFYPAAYSKVLAVGATDQTDQKASFSNYGDWVAVYAPGKNILSTVPGGGYEEKNGTSMAAPIAAGLAALILSIDNTLTSEAVYDKIRVSADVVDGISRINVHKALATLSLPARIVNAPAEKKEVSFAPTPDVDRAQIDSQSARLEGSLLNYPNPFRPAVSADRQAPGGVIETAAQTGTAIAYTLNRDASGQLFVYDITGQLVWQRTFTEGTPGGRAGYNEVAWNGVSDFGEVISNGIYLYRLVVDGQTLGIGKMMVLQ